ncbi:MAG: hypothetical protein K2N50_03675 [Clostridia bacterium]|nr:hypothetical protein [Clostridia bacterium]
MRSCRSITSAITLRRSGSEGSCGVLFFSLYVFTGCALEAAFSVPETEEMPPNSFKRLNKAKFSVK